MNMSHGKRLEQILKRHQGLERIFAREKQYLLAEMEKERCNALANRIKGTVIDSLIEEYEAHMKDAAKDCHFLDAHNWKEAIKALRSIE